MKSYIETRAVEIANYIVENNATVRQAAKQFGISKSTVHKDITDADRLLRIEMCIRDRCSGCCPDEEPPDRCTGSSAVKPCYIDKYTRKSVLGIFL